ncbi:MAG: hypothetical protein ACR2L2_14445 [Acidobacteriota bacterium]
MTSRPYRLVVSLFFLAVILLVYNYRANARQPATERVTAPQTEQQANRGIARVRVGPDGAYFVERVNNTIDKYDARGKILWTVSLGGPSQQAPLSVYSFALDARGDVLALGVLKDSKTMAIQKISGTPPVVVPWGSYAALAPGRIEVAPDGTIYFSAFSAKTFNEAVHAGKRPEQPIRGKLLHRVGAHGDIVRSFADFEYLPASSKELDQFIDRLTHTAPVFAPGGALYLSVRNEPMIRQIDLESGRTTGTVYLSHSGALGEVVLNHLEFVSDSELLYTLQKVDESRLLAGYEVRLLNIDSGEPTLIEDFRGNERAVSAHYNRAAGDVLLFDLVGIGGAKPQIRSLPAINRRAASRRNR